MTASLPDMPGALTRLMGAAAKLAEVFRDPLTARQAGAAMTCAEAETVAEVMYAVGRDDAAEAFLFGHANGETAADGDNDPDDEHYHLRVWLQAAES